MEALHSPGTIQQETTVKPQKAKLCLLIAQPRANCDLLTPTNFVQPWSGDSPGAKCAINSPIDTLALSPSPTYGYDIIMPACPTITITTYACCCCSFSDITTSVLPCANVFHKYRIVLYKILSIPPRYYRTSNVNFTVLPHYHRQMYGITVPPLWFHPYRNHTTVPPASVAASPAAPGAARSSRSSRQAGNNHYYFLTINQRIIIVHSSEQKFMQQWNP